MLRARAQANEVRYYKIRESGLVSLVDEAIGLEFFNTPQDPYTSSVITVSSGDSRVIGSEVINATET